MAMRIGKPSPDPGLGPRVELRGSYAPSQVHLARIGKALTSQRVATKEPPPALLEIKPAGPFGMKTWCRRG